MKNELLLLVEKHAGTLIKQTKTKQQETLDFTINEQMETSFNALINFIEEGKWLLALTSFYETNSVVYLMEK